MHDETRIFECYANEYAEFLPAAKDARILDIGAGKGQFLSFLKRQGYANAEGVERSREMVHACRASGLDVRHVLNLARTLQGRPNRYDLIVMLGVLEHLQKREVMGALRAVRHGLRTGGRFLVSVPNLGNPFALPLHHLDWTHEVGYTVTSLEQVLLSAGFTDVVVRGSRIYVRSAWKRPIFRTVRAATLGAFQWLLRTLVYPGDPIPLRFEKDLVAIAARGSR